MFDQTEFELLYFVIKECSTDWKIKNESISFCDLTMVLEGSVNYYVDDKKVSVKKGEAVFIKKGSKRKAETSFAKVCAFNFNFLSDIPSIPQKMRFKNLDYLLTEFNKTWSIKNKNYQLKCKAIFMWVFYELFKGETHESIYTKKIRNYVAENIERKITVTELSENLKINAVYCGAVFKKETGETILNYVNRMKITRAEEMLIFDNLSVSEVAYQLGFDDIFYFSRLFKKISGFSPSAYKKSI